jgi:hypothetical protein
MGFFSWNTNDTGKSIANHYSAKDTFTVYMKDDKNNEWIEHDYQGYGEFGGKDFHILLAEMNGLVDETTPEGTRNNGISLDCHPETAEKNFGLKQIKFPNLFEHRTSEWNGKPQESCGAQGYFYVLCENEMCGELFSWDESSCPVCDWSEDQLE